MTVGGERILEGWMAVEAGGDEDDETRGFGAAMMGGGRVSGIEIPLVDTVYGNFPDDPPTAIITATSTGKGRRGVEEDSHPNIEYADAVGLPEGWKHRRLPRKDKSHSDPYWYSPMMNYKFNSIPKVRRFLDHMEDANGDEVMAYETMHPSARRRSGGGGVGGKGGGRSPSSGVVIVVNDSTNDSDDDYGNKRRRGGKGGGGGHRASHLGQAGRPGRRCAAARECFRCLAWRHCGHTLTQTLKRGMRCALRQPPPPLG